MNIIGNNKQYLVAPYNRGPPTVYVIVRVSVCAYECLKLFTYVSILGGRVCCISNKCGTLNKTNYLTSFFAVVAA